MATPCVHLKPEPLRRINGIFGRKFDERLVPIEEETEVVKVSGFILKPEFAKKKRGEQFFFVNDRFIKSPYLHNALREAFEEVLTAEHHPGYFLHLQVDPQSLDVNIHPTKTEVKFEDERTIYAVLRSAARHAIGQFNVAPPLTLMQNKALKFRPYLKDTFQNRLRSKSIQTSTPSSRRNLLRRASDPTTSGTSVLKTKNTSTPSMLSMLQKSGTSKMPYPWTP